MQTDKGMLILCIVGAMVILINGGLLLLLLRGKPAKELDLFMRATRILRDPFKEQDEQQKELRRRVQDLEENERRHENNEDR